MAKVEQFPDQSGENINKEENTAEDIAQQKTRKMPESIRNYKAQKMPDDSLLMGSSSGAPSAENAKEAASGGTGPAGAPLADTASGQETGGTGGGPKRDYKEMIRIHRGRIRAIRVFAALIVVLAAALVVLYFSNRHYNRAEITKIRDFVAEEGSVCVNFDGCILQYGPNGAACADTGGRVRWSITYEMDQPIVSMSGNVAAIADYGGRTIYVFNTRKQLYSISTSLPVHKVSASESGEVAAILDDNTNTWIRLYSDTGKEIAYMIRSMEENGYPMDVAVSPNGKVVCVSSLLMKDASVVSNLSFYNFGKAGSSYDQHMVVNFEYTDEVFPYVRFLGNGACAAASDSRLVVFDTSKTEPQNSINNMLTEDLQGIFKSGDRIGLLFTDLTQENLYRLDVFGQDGRKEGSVGFTMVYDDLQIRGDKVYINNEQSMQIYTIDGREIFNGGFDRAVKVLIPSWRLGGLAAVSENEIDAIKLR